MRYVLYTQSTFQLKRRQQSIMSLFLLLLLLLLISCFLSTATVAAPITPPAKPSASVASDSAPDSLAVEMKLLRERQDLLVDAAQRDLSRMQIAFGAVAVLFAFFSIFSAIRQVLDQKRRDRLEDQQMSEAKGVMNSFKDNITTINSLIGSLKHAYDYQAKISLSLEDLNKRIKVVDDFKNNEEIRFRSEIDGLNNRSTQIFRDCLLDKRDRESFKQEQNRLALNSIAVDLKTLERIRGAGGLVSPVALFLRALSRFNNMEYTEAAADFAAARDAARPQMESPLNQYAKWDTDEVRKNLRVVIDEVSYHLGIIHYNLGQYDSAKTEFTAAYDRNPLDFRSRIYIPELMFFDETSDPRKTEEEYRIVEDELSNITSENRKQMIAPSPSWEAHYASLKLRQGNFYLRKPFAAPDRRAKWGPHENPTEAVKCYWQAYDKQSESMFIKFSLAQALVDIGRSSEWRDTDPEKLFREVFFRFRNDAILKTEPIMLTTLYFCSAISCFYVRLPGESPTMYLVQCRQNLQRVPKNIRVFSPLSKTNLSRDRLIEEMLQLEAWWQTKIEGGQR